MKIRETLFPLLLLSMSFKNRFYPEPRCTAALLWVSQKMYFDSGCELVLLKSNSFLLLVPNLGSVTAQEKSC